MEALTRLDRLMVAESTAKGHVRSLIEQYGATSRLDVAARVRWLGGR